MNRIIPHFFKCSFYLSSLLVYLNFCSALNLFVEDWESGNLNQWNSWGSPLPILNSSETAIGDYSLDPNGDGSYHSGLVSQQMFNLSGGVRFALDAFIESSSAWSELEFGLVDTNAIPNSPNTSHYTMATVLIDADSQGTGYKLYANLFGEGASQTIIKNELATNYFNEWHRFNFDFESDGSISISIDDQSIFRSDSGVFDYNSEPSFALMLAGRSYGSSENLYDNISLVAVPEFAYFNLVLSISIFFVLILSRGRYKRISNLF